MKLNSETWRALSDLLDTALDMTDAERTAWLDALEGEQAALKPLLREMLGRNAARETRDFIDALPRFEIADEPAAAEFRPGVVVGAYRLLRELGQGGMGEVWLAERADGLLRRPVALKLPFVALSRRALAERFAREREILASLNHPHIARLYDAGLAVDGQPFLALEYVDGIPLTHFADEKRLDIDARLSLFDQVIGAVAYAHANLVLHRDLKPSNILVAGQGDVKLLDFGVAKLMEDGAANETELTRFAGRALTLDYAAPEQIAGSSLTTAVDVYALGVVLYELVAGARPYRLKRGTRAELEEAIAAADPLPPSRAVTSEGIAAARGTTVRRLRRVLAGDLDTIVQKALRKTPGERYASARELGEDLERFRHGAPVFAQPDRIAYRARKFVLRHRIGLSVTACVALALIGATAVAIRQARVATLEAKRADASRNFLTQLFQSAGRNNPGGAVAGDTPARVLLEIGSRQVLERSRDDPDLRVDLLRMLSTLNLELDLMAPAAKLSEQAIAVARERYGEGSLPYAQALEVRGENRYRAASYTEAIDDMRRVIAIAERFPRDSVELRAKAHMILGNSLYQVDAYKQAEPRRYLETSLALFKEARSKSEDRSRAAYYLAWTYEPTRDFGRAEALYREGIAIGRENFGEKSFIVAFGYEGLADMLRQQTRLDEAREAIGNAISIYEFVLGPRHGTVAFAKTNLAMIEAASGRRAEAERLADEAVVLARDVFGDHARQVGYPAMFTARLKANRGELESAAEAYERALDVFRGEAPSSHSNRLLRLEYAEVLIALGRTARAEALLDEAEAAFKASDDMATLRGAWLRTARGELAYARDDKATSDASFEQVLRETAARKESAASFLPRFAAAVARAHPQPERAEAVLALLRKQELLPSRPSELNLDYEDKARLEFAVGRLYLALGRNDDARTWLESAVAARESSDIATSPWLAEARAALTEARR